ncbi:MAG: ATP-dependent metallopeptidase FtsH/Yme1/Tma family protein [Betaproteobacteria bacterium]|nr:ATP-dependent metallopeptidase FtsH/Yme1/Tma family protein [Betaproteobacteria bacterium]
MEHCQRPWWKRPPFWFIGIAAAVIVLVVAVEKSGKTALMPYSAFLDQLEAGNVATVTFKGAEINGRLKRPLDSPLPTGTAQRDTFRSAVPEVGDPTLVPELHRQHVVIDVTVPSAWTWLLGRVPWPMLILVGAMLIVGFIKLVREGKAQSGPAASMPAHGMIGLVSNLFSKRSKTETPPTRDGDERQGR